MQNLVEEARLLMLFTRYVDWSANKVVGGGIPRLTSIAVYFIIKSV